MARIGICEDDASVRRAVVEILTSAGHTAVSARSGHDALALWSAPGSVDLMVIDIGLPDTDGRDLCAALRAGGQHAPVLFLTALDGPHNRISGFTAGGDDYVVKPFSVGEVLARIDALLRRTRPEPDHVEGFRLDPGRFSVRTSTGEERLTPTEFRILARLASEPGVVIRRRAVVAAGWPEGAIVSENTIDSYLRRLRTKLAAVDSPVHVETVRGVGYVLQ
jgi:two-component system, OmpR family, response regulator